MFLAGTAPTAQKRQDKSNLQMATAGMNGQVNDLKKTNPQMLLPPTLLKFPYRYVMVFTVLAQAVSLTIAYLLGLKLHYRRLIMTHCVVPNFWPSISKVTGDHLPERYVWRLAIALISFPRIMDGFLYHKFFATRRPLLLQKRWYLWLNRLNSFLLITQLFLFYTCVFISSLEHMDIHLLGWLVFLLFSLAHMITFLIIFGCGAQKPLTKKERTSLRLRGVFFSVQLITIIVFVYYAIMHTDFCQPYAYSIAAICEDIIAASNLGFHAVQLLDFYSLELYYCLPWDRELKLA